MESNNALILLQEKKWSEVFKLLDKPLLYNKLMEDFMFSNIFTKYFIPELISHSEFNDEEKYLYFSKVNNLHKSESNNFKLDQDQHLELTLELLKIKEDYHLAKIHPENSTCKAIIDKYTQEEKYKSEIVKNEFILKNKLDLKEFKATGQELTTYSILKSPQELEFFNAAKYVFKEYLIVPNAALSTVIPSSSINPTIVFDKWLYLISTVDFVVVNLKSFKPILFFELDSKRHDEENQIKKDNVKNLLINNAGYNIYRVTKKVNEDSTDFFEIYLNNIKNDLGLS